MEDVELFCLKYQLGIEDLFRTASSGFHYKEDVQHFHLYGLVPLYVERYIHVHRFDLPL